MESERRSASVSYTHLDVYKRQGVDWANTAIYAIFMVVMIDVWHAVGFNFVIISAGTKDISPDLYEAAELDGASSWQKMRYITIPLL